MSAVGDRIDQVLQRIRELGRADDCRLMAVSKGQPREQIDEVLQAGVRLFGESRVQEARIKWSEGVDASVELHMIGHLQTNKAREAIRVFSAVDSVDSARIASALNAGLSHRLSVMLEVNPGQEATKRGLYTDQVRPFLSKAHQWPWLQFDGILAMMPKAKDASLGENKRIRRLMQETAELWRSCQIDQWPWAPLSELSMGMTDDYEWALEAGATIVRIGQGVFGPRD